MFPRLLCTLIALVLVLVQPAWAAPPGSAVDTASTLYTGLDYEGCMKHVETALVEPRESAEIAQLHLFRALCEHGIGHEDAATSHLQVALALDPTARAPQWASPRVHAFVDGVVKQFNEASEKAAATPSDAPLQNPPAPAVATAVATTQPSPPVTPASTPAAAISPPAPAPSPGAGLTTARWVLTGAAGAFAATGVGFGLHARSLEQKVHTTLWMNERMTLSSDAKLGAMLANVSFGLAAGAAIGALATWLFPDALSSALGSTPPPVVLGPP